MQKLQTWIELSREAYKNNILFTKKRLKPNVELKLVVKANAYGHGVEQIVKMAMVHYIIMEKHGNSVHLKKMGIYGLYFEFEMAQ